MVTQLEKYGPMREVWMYAFESLNGHIKSLARSNSLPVQAIMNSIKRVKVLRMVRGLIIFITAGVSARMPAAVTMGSRGAIAVDVSARGKRVVLRDDEIQHLKVWMRTQIPAYGDLVERWEKYAEDARR
jgi:hypothetical protein